MTKQWPEDWRGMMDRMPSCDRCNKILCHPLFNLCNEYPDLLVCRSCSNDYFSHKMKFIDEVRTNKGIKEGEIIDKKYKGIFDD